MLVYSKFPSELRSEFNSNFKNLRVQLNLAGAKSVLITAYYKPHESDPESIASFEELTKSLTLVMFGSLGTLIYPKLTGKISYHHQNLL